MRRSLGTLTLVFRDPFNVGLGALTAVTSAAGLAWAGQIVSGFSMGGVFVDRDPGRITAVALLSVALGVLVPLDVELVRRLRGRVRMRAGAGLTGGVAAAVAAMSCCAPLLIPAVAALLGASGTTLLTLNLRLHAWFLPMTLVSLAVLLLSAALAVRDLGRACSLP